MPCGEYYSGGPAETSLHRGYRGLSEVKRLRKSERRGIFCQSDEVVSYSVLHGTFCRPRGLPAKRGETVRPLLAKARGPVNRYPQVAKGVCSPGSEVCRRECRTTRPKETEHMIQCLCSSGSFPSYESNLLF